MNRFIRALAPALAGLLLAALVLLPLRAGPAVAAGIEVHTLNTAPITTTSTFGGGRWTAIGVDQTPTVAEIYLLVAMPTVNTTTFSLQISPDGETWLNHSSAGTLASGVVTDTNTYTRTTVEGIFYRIVATASATGTLTPTIKVVLR